MDIADDGRRDPWTDAGLVALVVIWGVNFPVIKVALRELHPLAFNALRFPLAAGVLWALLRTRGAIRLPRREDLPRIVALGLLGNVAYQLLFIFGIDATLAGNASILLATTPVWTIILSNLRGHERSPWPVWAGVGATVAGMALVVLGGQQRVALGGDTLRGDLLSAAAGVVWAVYTVEGRDVIARYGSLRVTAWTLWVGTAALVVLGLPFLARTDLAVLSPAAWGGVAYAGVLAIGVAYLLWYWGVQRIGSTRTSVFSNLVPVVALVVAWAWIGETPTALQLAGAAVVLGGMTLARLVRRGGGRGGHPGEGSPRDAGAPGR